MSCEYISSFCRFSFNCRIMITCHMARRSLNLQKWTVIMTVTCPEHKNKLLRLLIHEQRQIKNISHKASAWIQQIPQVMCMPTFFEGWPSSMGCFGFKNTFEGAGSLWALAGKLHTFNLKIQPVMTNATQTSYHLTLPQKARRLCVQILIGE